MRRHSKAKPIEFGTRKFLSNICSQNLHQSPYALILVLVLTPWVSSTQQLSTAAEIAAEDVNSSRRSQPTSPANAGSTTLMEPDSNVQQPEIMASSTPLDAREVACLAACRWHPAIGLKQRARTINRLFCEDTPSKQQASKTIVRFLHLQAAFQEDIGAASAMRAYYSRIGILEQQKWIVTAGEAVELQQQKQQSLMDQGFAAGIDLSSLERKNLDLQDQWLQTDSQLRQIQKLICSLTGIDVSNSNWAFEPLVIYPNPMDCELLVAQALRQRCDLQAWQELSCQTDESTAPLVATLISTLSSTFGLPIPTASLLKQLTCQGLDPCILAESLRQELTVIAQTHQAFIEQSVREKCEQLQLAYHRHDVELKRIDSWLGRLAQLDRLESLGQQRPDQRMVAEAGLLEARTTEVTRRLEAKLAEVALAEATGGLAAACCQGRAWLPTGF